MSAIRLASLALARELPRPTTTTELKSPMMATTTNISIKVKNVQMVSQVIQEVTKAGANQVQGARFSVDNPEKDRERARNIAIQNAKTQAQKLAKTLGIRLGKITNIVESSPPQGPIVYPMARFEAGIAGSGGPQIEPGNQTISSVVTLFFEKK